MVAGSLRRATREERRLGEEGEEVREEGCSVMVGGAPGGGGGGGEKRGRGGEVGEGGEGGGVGERVLTFLNSYL